METIRLPTKLVNPVSFSPRLLKYRDTAKEIKHRASGISHLEMGENSDGPLKTVLGEWTGDRAQAFGNRSSRNRERFCQGD